jgi:hypothetical protein
VCSSLVTVGLLAPGAGATLDKYLNTATLNSGAHGGPSSSAYWAENTVWRPIGYWFELWYHNSANSYAGIGTNSSMNPYSLPRHVWGYSQGYCRNDSVFTVSPVTCQVST